MKGGRHCELYVIEDLLRDLGEIPEGVFLRIALLPVAELQLVIGKGHHPAVSKAEGKMEELILPVIKQGKELHRLDNAHQAGVFLLFNGLGDEASDIAPEDIIAGVSRNLDHLCRRFRDLIGLVANDDKTLGCFRSSGKQFGYADLQGIGEAFEFRNSGITFDAGKQIADRSAHAVCNVGESQAFGLDNLPEVLFYVGHN